MFYRAFFVLVLCWRFLDMSVPGLPYPVLACGITPLRVSMKFSRQPPKACSQVLCNILHFAFVCWGLEQCELLFSPYHMFLYRQVRNTIFKGVKPLAVGGMFYCSALRITILLCSVISCTSLFLPCLSLLYSDCASLCYLRDKRGEPVIFDVLFCRFLWCSNTRRIPL